MQKVTLKEISFDNINYQIEIKSTTYKIRDIRLKYSESFLFSYLIIEINEHKYLLRGLKSVWEHLNISTYDWSEKREDNKVFNLYCQLSDAETSQKE